MKLYEFITLIKEGSLHQVNITQDSLISFTNLGLQTLSDEFDLLRKTTSISILENTKSYTLPTDLESVYIITTSGKYWRDNQGNLTNTLSTDFEVGVNITGDYNSIFINSNTTLTVPYPVAGQILVMEYKAVSPVLISPTETLPLASQYIIALMLYVTYLGFLQALGTSHADTNAAFKMYKDVINTLKTSGTYISNYGSNNKFIERGFV